MEHYHLIGIGGIGMSGLAQVLLHEGIGVSGSDRSYDRGENIELFNKLKNLGIKIYPQNGSRVKKGISKIIISKAIEEDNPDLVAAKRLKIPISYRQDELKNVFRQYSGIAVSGTSGKTTVVGMIGCIFDVAGLDITVVNGGMIKNYITESNIGNVHIGRLPYFCIETDESEGNLSGYYPEIGVLTNIGSDHMDYKNLIKVYKNFASQVKDVLVLNKDSNLYVKSKKKITYSINNNSDIVAKNIDLHQDYSLFKVSGNKFRLNVPGLHNIYNALAAIGVANVWGISIKQIANGLERFKGIRRRFDVLDGIRGVRVIDDYAHNPDKIKATLQTAHIGKGRVLAIYQPHGYGPTKMFLKELAGVFASNLNKKDYLFIPEIYYAGGTVKKDISSGDLAKEIKKRNRLLNVEYVPKRDEIIAVLRNIARRGDKILVMGARDATLRDWAKKILI